MGRPPALEILALGTLEPLQILPSRRMQAMRSHRRNLRSALPFVFLGSCLLLGGFLATPRVFAEDPISAPKVEIRNARVPMEGLLTGGQPTPEQFEEAAQAGYRTVVNLRAPGEKGSWDEAAKATELGIDYIALPIAGGGDLSQENARALAKILDAPERRPMMIHCASGNRVGALFALIAHHLDGASPEDALERGRAAGLTSLEPVVREKLGLPTEDAP